MRPMTATWLPWRGSQTPVVWRRSPPSNAPPDVKVFFNIGTGRIGTLLIFGINRIGGNFVITGESRKVCLLDEVSHGREAPRITRL